MQILLRMTTVGLAWIRPSVRPSVLLSVCPSPPLPRLAMSFPFLFSLFAPPPSNIPSRSRARPSCPMPTRNIQKFQTKDGTPLGSVQPPPWAADYERIILWRDIQNAFVGVIYLQHPSGNSVLFMTDKNGELYVASFFLPLMAKTG